MHPSIALMLIYVVVTATLQFGGFLVSRLIELAAPSAGLVVFLILFLGMFWVAWPIALRIAEALVPGVKQS